MSSDLVKNYLKKTQLPSEKWGDLQSIVAELPKRVEPYSIVVKNLTSQSLHNVEVLNARDNFDKVFYGKVIGDGYEIKAYGVDDYQTILNNIITKPVVLRQTFARFNSKEEFDNLKRIYKEPDYFKIRRPDENGKLTDKNIPAFIDPYCHEENTFAVLSCEKFKICEQTRFVIKEMFPNSEYVIVLYPKEYTA